MVFFLVARQVCFVSFCFSPGAFAAALCNASLVARA